MNTGFSCLHVLCEHMTRNSSISVETRLSSERNWKPWRIYWEWEDWQKWRYRLGDQSRCGSTRDDAWTSLPACTVQRHDSTLKLRQHPPCHVGSTRGTLSPPVAWHPADTGNSLVFPRGVRPCEKPYEKCELNKESLRESDHFCRAIFLINDELAIRVASRDQFIAGNQLRFIRNKRIITLKALFFSFRSSRKLEVNFKRTKIYIHLAGTIHLSCTNVLSLTWKMRYSDRMSVVGDLDCVPYRGYRSRFVVCRGTERWQRWT